MLACVFRSFFQEGNSTARPILSRAGVSFACQAPCVFSRPWRHSAGHQRAEQCVFNHAGEQCLWLVLLLPWHCRGAGLLLRSYQPSDCAFYICCGHLNRGEFKEARKTLGQLLLSDPTNARAAVMLELLQRRVRAGMCSFESKIMWVIRPSSLAHPPHRHSPESPQ